MHLFQTFAAVVFSGYSFIFLPCTVQAQTHEIFEVRLEQRPSSGDSAVESITLPTRRGTTEQLTAIKAPFLTTMDIDDVSVDIGRPVTEEDYKMTMAKAPPGYKLSLEEFLKANDEVNRIIVSFNDRGRETLREVTSANVGRKVVIFIEGRPIIAPVIREAIAQGKMSLAGGFSQGEVESYADVIRSAIKGIIG